MEHFNRRHLQTLLTEGESERLSCYIPMVRVGRETLQNPIRYKNAIRYAEQALYAHGMDKRGAGAIIGRIVDEVEAETGDQRFWDRQSDGLAIFASAEDCLLLSCAYEFAPSVTVASRFCIMPLVPLLNRDREFLVLAISRNSVRVVHASRERAEEIELSGAVPRSVTDVVGEDFEEQNLQFHWTSSDRGAVFHGQGAGEDDVLPELELYCRRVGGALVKELGTDTSIVLAGDTALAAIFRHVVKRPPLLDTGIEGNHDRTPPDQLRALGWPIIAERLVREDAEVVRLFHERRGENRASDDLEEIRAAAQQGRVEQLIVSREVALAAPRPIPDPAANDSPGNVGAEPPINADVVATLRHGGSARLLDAPDMPTEAEVAAIFRF
jgi:hypothetical protein